MTHKKPRTKTRKAKTPKIRQRMDYDPRTGANKLRFIDLFCGIGGFRLGFEKVGAECVFSNDWDKHSQLTYEANFGEKPLGDIHGIPEKSIPEHDILCAGFPCQPFSIAGVSKKLSLGKKHGFEDENQGNLFFTIAKILDYHKPAAFVLENVKNLKSHDQGRTFEIIHWTLTEVTPGSSVGLSLTAVALAFLRFEFLLFFTLLMTVQSLEGRWKQSFIIAGLTLLLLGPWSLRNHVVFGEAVWLSTGAGLNLFRGHNDMEIGVWGNDHIEKEIPNLPRTRRFEISLDSLYRAEALRFITENPGREALNSAKKFMHLWLYNPLQSGDREILSAFLSLPVLVLCFSGLRGTWTWRTAKIPVLFLVSSTIIGIVFFSLPRHQVIMKIALLPFAGAGCIAIREVLMNKFFKNRQHAENTKAGE